MPTYEYACKSCGERLEVVQSFTDEALTRCPACKKKQLRKVFGSIGITFKGSGFYKTDSRSGASSSPSPSSDGGSGSGDGGATKEAPAKESSTKESSTKDGASGKGDSSSGKGKGGATTSTTSGTSAA